jgi:hypothetical protein
MTPVLKLPEIHHRRAFNLARWKEICADPGLAQLPGRVESDAFGNILTSEVLSPGNTRAEMDEKLTLLFESGALEVWFCDTSGKMFFFPKHCPDTPLASPPLCPDFPQRVA